MAVTYGIMGRTRPLSWAARDAAVGQCLRFLFFFKVLFVSKISFAAFGIVNVKWLVSNI
jgi:hypothetical protein